MEIVIPPSSEEIEFQTDLRVLFKAFKGRQKEFNWLMTDLDISSITLEESELPSELKYWSNRDIWLSGDRLSEITDHNWIQYINGYFLAFARDLSYEDVMRENSSQVNNAKIRQSKRIHPLSIIDIEAHDSSYTFIITEDEDIISKIFSFFKQAYRCSDPYMLDI
jgi:hypothetical protein